MQLGALAQTKRTKTAADIGEAVVMIDPGHGGIDRGAMVKGLVEKTWFSILPRPSRPNSRPTALQGYHDT